MEVVNVSDKHINLLSNAIGQIVNFYSNNNKISCIYMKIYTIKNDLARPIQNLNEIKIRICVLYNEQLEKKDFCKLDRLIRKIGETIGVKLIIDFRDTYTYYANMDESRSYISCRDLYDSEILFDRNYYFTKLQEFLINENFNLSTPAATTVLFSPKLRIKNKVKGEKIDK